jgi:hypothetical protein
MRAINIACGNKGVDKWKFCNFQYINRPSPGMGTESTLYAFVYTVAGTACYSYRECNSLSVRLRSGILN